MLVNGLQADEMVNKVLQYHDTKSLGSWRQCGNHYGRLDIPSDASLQDRQNNLADMITTKTLLTSTK
jgi:hypothetical protein